MANPRPLLFLRLSSAELLKATVKKMITVPGYTRRDGSFVPPHQKSVHYNPEALFADVAAGNGSHSQKKAHAKLSGKSWWQALSVDGKAAAVMAMATDLQGAASASAAVAGWKKEALAGKNPKAAQWEAFNALPTEKKAALLDAVNDANGLAHLKAPAVSANKPAAALAPTLPATPQKSAASVAPAPTADPAPQTLADLSPTTAPGQVLGQKEAVDALLKMEAGPHYQKVAIAKLKQNAAWLGLSPSAQLEQATGLYKQLQGAASQAAAVSVAKKAMLAGKAPSKAQYLALMASGDKVMDKVAAAVGPAYQALMEKAAAAVADNLGSLGAAQEPSVTSPKEGDTKQGVGGLLVLKDGHWVLANPEGKDSGKASLAEQAFTAAPAQHSIDAIPMPSMDDFKNPALVKQALENLKQKIKEQGASALTGTTKHTKASGKLVVLLDSPSKPGAKLKITTNVGASGSHTAVYHYVLALKAAVGKPSKASKAAAASPAAAVFSPAPLSMPTAGAATTAPSGAPVIQSMGAGSMDGWKQVGKQAGTNPGGKFVDPSGQAWYVKFPASENHVRNELLASKLYEMLGVPGPQLMQVRDGKKVGIASRWVDGTKKVSPEKLKGLPGAVDNFPIDAWLANWDAVGTGYDNLLQGADGKAVRIDAGGSLLYRAQGTPKGGDFAADVPELESMTNPSMNSFAAAVFGGADPKQFSLALHKMALLKPSQIDEMIDAHGPKDAALVSELSSKLKSRRAFILKKYGIADPHNKPPVDESKIAVDPAKLPQALDFSNINGKPLSSKEHVNAQNTKDSQALVAFAAKGNLKALKDYHYDAVDKESGAVLGKKPILQHPAGLIQKQWGELVQTLQSIAHPSVETLAMPASGGILDAFFHPADNVSSIKSEFSMGFFMKVGDSVAPPALHSAPFALSAAHPLIKNAKAIYAGYSALTKKFIGSVQSSGWVNHVWSQGAQGVVSQMGVPIQKLASEIYKDSTEMPEGAILTRNMADSSGETVKALLAAKPGTTFQNTDSMCTSFKEEWNSFGGDITLKITCAKGSRALVSWGSGKYGSEKEITTLPGARLCITKVTQGAHGGGGAKGVTIECVMLPPVDGYLSLLENEVALGKSFHTGAAAKCKPNTTTPFLLRSPRQSGPRLWAIRTSSLPSFPSFARRAARCS